MKNSSKYTQKGRFEPLDLNFKKSWGAGKNMNAGFVFSVQTSMNNDYSRSRNPHLLRILLLKYFKLKYIEKRSSFVLKCHLWKLENVSLCCSLWENFLKKNKICVTVNNWQWVNWSKPLHWPMETWRTSPVMRCWSGSIGWLMETTAK